jgi:hypothetical protein
MIKKTDRNHAEIMQVLRKIPGVSVFSTHAVGKGFPDLVVGYMGMNYLLEVKDGEKPPSQRKLTADEVRFHNSWMGQIAIVNSIDDLIKIFTKG